MNIKKFLKILQNNSSIIVVSIILLIVTIINSVMYIGLLEDGHHHFWQALTTNNIFLGHEGFSLFPYNSRYFPTILAHLSVGIPIYLGIFSIKYLLFIFTFVSYITPLMILLIIYFNIPQDKKSVFELILLSFLICLVYMIYQIWTENLITGLFLWVIFVIYYYADFNNLSILNIVSILLFSIIIISSHPMVVIFIPVLLILGIKKYINTTKIKLSHKIVLIASFILLFYAFLFNTYFIVNPIFPMKDYFSFKIFQNINFILFFISTLLMLYISLSRNGNQKCYNCKISFIILCFLIINILTFNVRTSVGFTYRILGFYSPLFFIVLILISEKLKLAINFINIKTINIILCFIILMNSFYYGASWMKYIKSLEQEIINSQKTNITEVIKYNIYHKYSLPFILIFIPTLSNNNNLHNYLPVTFFQDSMNEIINKKETLKKFNIDIDNIIKSEN
ncbi:MAG: hypothetical protein PHG84_05155 [Endomicrobiaceae bacterium]|nr:hypothetical protein [Endomicrobiaceae bacterium]